MLFEKIVMVVVEIMVVMVGIGGMKKVIGISNVIVMVVDRLGIVFMKRLKMEELRIIVSM